MNRFDIDSLEAVVDRAAIGDAAGKSRDAADANSGVGRRQRAGIADAAGQRQAGDRDRLIGAGDLARAVDQDAMCRRQDIAAVKNRAGDRAATMSMPVLPVMVPEFEIFPVNVETPARAIAAPVTDTMPELLIPPAKSGDRVDINSERPGRNRAGIADAADKCRAADLDPRRGGHDLAGAVDRDADIRRLQEPAVDDRAEDGA